jgi:hypothetical protein
VNKTTPAKYIASTLARIHNLTVRADLGRASEARGALERWVGEHGPSGSGVDRGTVLHFDERSKVSSFKLAADFHHMDAHGAYDGWTCHNVIVTPGWESVDVRVTGRDRNQIKDHLGEMYHQWLNSEIPHPGLVENT